MDLVLERGRTRIGIEMKASSAPTVTKGFWNAKADLELTHAYVVAPVQEGFPLGHDVHVVSLKKLLQTLASLPR